MVNFLRAGESFTAVGKVVGSDWLLAARDDKTIGFVSASLAEPASSEAPVVAQPAPKPETPTESAEDAAVVTASVPCRTVTRTATLEDGRVIDETVEYCKSPDGRWLAEA